MKNKFVLAVLIFFVFSVGAKAQSHLSTPKIVKGLYITIDTFENDRLMENIQKIYQETSINTLVIDVRSNGINAFVIKNKKAKEKLDKLHSLNLYLVARIIVFWKPNGWFDPESEIRWKQVAQASRLAIDLGFDEINYDYVRYGGPREPKSRTPIEKRQPVIKSFFDYLDKEVAQKNSKPISVDIFGTTFLRPEMSIGQKVQDAAEHFDFIMPMVYPSHWAPGTFGIKDPGRASYEIIYKSLSEGWKTISKDKKNKSKLRPWLQAFGLDSIFPFRTMAYGANEVKDQIRACYDAGCSGWVLWNPSSKYERYIDALK